MHIMPEDEVHGLTRRDVLRGVAMAVPTRDLVVATVGGVTAAVIYKTVFDQKSGQEIDKQYLSSLFDLSDGLPGIFPGTGNIQARALGQKGISDYLEFSSRTLLDFITCTMDVSRCVVRDYNDDAFIYDPRKQSIFLGSPVANYESRGVMGYKLASHAAPYAVPEINYEDTKVRWVFSFGESQFGMYDGKLKLADRYGPADTLVHRPVYKLVDKANRRTVAPSTTNGMLNHEWMLIVRRKSKGNFKTVVAGMHGCGTQSFFDDFRDNLEKLYEKTEGKEEYQVLVPVQLDHSAGLDGIHRTTGKLDWSQSDLHVIR